MKATQFPFKGRDMVATSCKTYISGWHIVTEWYGYTANSKQPCRRKVVKANPDYVMPREPETAPSKQLTNR
jgi:hypothetical protein